MADITKAAVVRRIDDVIAALGKYGAEVGREVELIVRPDEWMSLMVGDEAGTSFEEVQRFESTDELWAFVECRVEVSCG